MNVHMSIERLLYGACRVLTRDQDVVDRVGDTVVDDQCEVSRGRGMKQMNEYQAFMKMSSSSPQIDPVHSVRR